MADQKFRRKKILVDPELQIGMSTEMVGWIYVYFLLFSLVANLPSVISVVQSDPETTAYIAALDQLRGFARHVVLPMAITFVAMAIHGVYVTHRIAGPMVRFKRCMREIASRRTPVPFSLRDKDQFKDLAEEMNAAISVLCEDAERRKRTSEDTLAQVRSLIQTLESSPEDLGPALQSAYAVLDGVETLDRQLEVTEVEAPDAQPSRLVSSEPAPSEPAAPAQGAETPVHAASSAASE